MNRSPLLVISPYLPFPTRFNGLSIRLSPVIKALSEIREINLLVVGQNRLDNSESIDEAKRYCRTLAVVNAHEGKLRTRFELLRSLVASPAPPHRLLFPLTARILQQVQRIKEEQGIGTVLSLGDLLSHSAIVSKRRSPHIRHVVDWVDSPALHLERVERSSEKYRARAVDAMVRWERLVNEGMDASIYISNMDQNFANFERSEKTSVLPNGLVDDFPVARDASWREAMSALPTLTLGFLGNMGYEPNDEAARSLCADFLPYIQRELPDLDVQLKIVGKNPTDALRSFSGRNIKVTGAVEEIWPHLEDVDVFVFPMVRGAGMQNKVIEAMRCRRPVVATSICIAGLPDTSSLDVKRADSLQETVAHLRALTSDSRARRETIEVNMRYINSLRSEEMVEKYVRVL